MIWGWRDLVFGWVKQRISEREKEYDRKKIPENTEIMRYRKYWWVYTNRKVRDFKAYERVEVQGNCKNEWLIQLNKISYKSCF